MVWCSAQSRCSQAAKQTIALTAPCIHSAGSHRAYRDERMLGAAAAAAAAEAGNVPGEGAAAADTAVEHRAQSNSSDSLITDPGSLYKQSDHRPWFTIQSV